MPDVILNQLLQVFSSSLSIVQMKDKMVLSPQNKVCSHSQQKHFECLRQFEKMHSEKTVQQKRKLF